MAWKNIPGLTGRVYIPEEEPGTPKKHGCGDCFSCQMCSDDRCRLCGEGKCPGKRGEGLQRTACNPMETPPCGRKDCNGSD